ncbi:MAG: hypothetical protein ABR588_10270 [Sphingomicrobium sp.]|nr:hypothetical protein [Sphingomonadales bacterium]
MQSDRPCAVTGGTFAARLGSTVTTAPGGTTIDEVELAGADDLAAGPLVCAAAIPAIVNISAAKIMRFTN